MTQTVRKNFLVKSLAPLVAELTISQNKRAHANAGTSTVSEPGDKLFQKLVTDIQTGKIDAKSKSRCAIVPWLR